MSNTTVLRLAGRTTTLSVAATAHAAVTVSAVGGSVLSNYASFLNTGATNVAVEISPVGVTATHIRPLTNNDPGNVFPTGFGLPRPLKHYRKGTVIPLKFEPLDNGLIEYNINRAVKSSVGRIANGRLSTCSWSLLTSCTLFT